MTNYDLFCNQLLNELECIENKLHPTFVPKTESSSASIGGVIYSKKLDAEFNYGLYINPDYSLNIIIGLVNTECSLDLMLDINSYNLDSNNKAVFVDDSVLILCDGYIPVGKRSKSIYNRLINILEAKACRELFNKWGKDFYDSPKSEYVS